MKKTKSHQPAISRFFAPKPKAKPDTQAPAHKPLSRERESLTPVREEPPRTPGKTISDGGQVTVSPDRVLATKRKDSGAHEDAAIKRRKIGSDSESDRRTKVSGNLGDKSPEVERVQPEDDGPLVLEQKNKAPPAVGRERGEGSLGSEKHFPKSDPVRHAKFVEKLLARSDDQGRLAERSGGAQITGPGVKYTPLELQIIELQKRYPDVLLMVEVGYKYRFFGSDAETAARVLNIFAHYDHNFLTASVPTHRLHVHVRRLVEAGFKVGVVRQAETAAIKSQGPSKSALFGRRLSALYTRATLEAGEDLGGGPQDDAVGKGRLSSYLMCIAEESLDVSKKPSRLPQKVIKTEEDEMASEGPSSLAGGFDASFGVVAVETATGDVMYGHFKDTVMRSDLESCMISAAPVELLLADPISGPTEKLLRDFAGPSGVRTERVSRAKFQAGGASSYVADFYCSKRRGAQDGDPARVGVLGADADREEGGDEEKGARSLETVLELPDLVLQALALALDYLRAFGLEDVLRLGATFRPFAAVQEMCLSPNALRQLEILRNSADGTDKGSLLWLMDQTSTPFGGRLLRHWICHPLRNLDMIAARAGAVQELAGSLGTSALEGRFPGSGRGGVGNVAAAAAAAEGSVGGLAGILGSLGKMPDVERGITRLFHRTATPSEFVSVVQALLQVSRRLGHVPVSEGHVAASGASSGDEADGGTGAAVKAPLLRRLLAAATSATVVREAKKLLAGVDASAAKSAPASEKTNLFVCENGRFPEVASCKSRIRACERELEDLLPGLRKLLRNPSLQYKSVLGTDYLVEAPPAQRVPADWIKVSTTKAQIRYHPPEVLAAFESLAVAREELTAACNRAWDAFLADFAEHYVDFRAAVQALAALDCLHSLAILSQNQGYVRPTFVSQEEPPQLRIVGGRHPVLEATLKDNFVPNDTCLLGNGERCQIITGPNMGGKSVYIRQVALIVIMAQMGSFVPADAATLHVFDNVHTRMGASDSIQRGRSTFLEELSEASAIIRGASAHSLVIMDELGRGTSTHDGVAIAYATLHNLLVEKRALSLFVTHYPQIAELRKEFPSQIGTYFVSYLAEEATRRPPGGGPADVARGEGDLAEANAAEEAAQKVTFLYKLVPGVAPRSFGLHVARLAEIPDRVVAQAAHVATRMQAEVTERARKRRRKLENGHAVSPGADDSEEQQHTSAGTSGDSNDGESEGEDELKARFAGASEAEKAQILIEQLRRLPSVAGRKEEFLERLQRLVKVEAS